MNPTETPTPADLTCIERGPLDSPAGIVYHCPVCDVWHVHAAMTCHLMGTHGLNREAVLALKWAAFKRRKGVG